MESLKEKLEKEFGITAIVDIDAVEKIADEHAIGFAEWLPKNCIFGLGLRWYHKGHSHTETELLEIYKSESKTQ